MSSHSRPVELSERAQLDYSDILLDSALSWGESQARQFRVQLDRAIAELGEYPEIGPVRYNRPLGYRTRRVEQHIIYYRITPNTIYVSRILHSRRDVRPQDLR